MIYILNIKISSIQPWLSIFPQYALKGGSVINLYNPNGKYSVKLNVLGKWRRINVDDRIFEDKNKQKMLPCLINGDIWFSLICKALLKVAIYE